MSDGISTIEAAAIGAFASLVVTIWREHFARKFERGKIERQERKELLIRIADDFSEVNGEVEQAFIKLTNTVKGLLKPGETSYSVATAADTVLEDAFLKLYSICFRIEGRAIFLGEAQSLEVKTYRIKASELLQTSKDRGVAELLRMDQLFSEKCLASDKIIQEVIEIRATFNQRLAEIYRGLCQPPPPRAARIINRQRAP